MGKRASQRGSIGSVLGMTPVREQHATVDSE
jgi:hypothetical protein